VAGDPAFQDSVDFGGSSGQSAGGRAKPAAKVVVEGLMDTHAIRIGQDVIVPQCLARAIVQSLRARFPTHL
jgi:hypothetical protein